MGISQRGCLVLIMFTIVLLASSQFMEASRVLKGDNWMEEKEEVRLFMLPVQVLQRGPVPPSGRNPCSNIPGQSNGRCTLQNMNNAGGRHSAAHAPPAIPDSTAESS